MNLLRTSEQNDLADAVRALLAADSPASRVREIADDPGTAFDPRLWGRLSGDLGVTGLLVAEEHGGAGAGLGEVAVVMEELGSSLAPLPYLASAILSAGAIGRLSGPETAARLLPGIAAGTTVATLALPSAPAPAATATGLLSGTLPNVAFGLQADLILVPAVRDGEPLLFAVEAGAPGLTRTPLTGLDPTASQARVVLDGTPGTLIGPAGDALAPVLDLAAVALAAEQLGVMRRCLTAIVDYAKIRVQFGRFIGSFQGVKHRLADMHCTLEQAESIVRYAAWAADHDPAELPVAAALAQSYVGPAAFEIARDHLLLHGGIGFTWEHDAHLYFKRAKAAQHLLGPTRVHRARLAAGLGLA
ncbi:acyl-CoA dehydrogenase family protein [Actinocorallia longicatena]|uniref:Acyl-CoA dehydrogenase family protein n=1 Tax=Actinocorallia longicatena TaxID=111803 RepID=A0ABP6QMS5_9ACTN